MGRDVRQPVLAHFDISQGGRFNAWQSLGALPIPRQQVAQQSANTHIAPVGFELSWIDSGTEQLESPHMKAATERGDLRLRCL